MNISASYYSAKGGRPTNQDAISLLEGQDTILAMVADGLGGHEDGDKAAKLAIQKINEKTAHSQVSAVTLENAVKAANRVILDNQEGNRMRTTIAALWTDGESALTATVGDTRIYQFRKDKILFQSMDHSIAQMAVLMGEITTDQIRGHHDRNKLIRALGSQDELKIDLTSLKIEAGDAFLLCSDGFWENVWESDMLEDLHSSSGAREWLEKMRRKSELRMKPTGDNHSAIALIIQP